MVGPILLLSEYKTGRLVLSICNKNVHLTTNSWYLFEAKRKKTDIKARLSMIFKPLILISTLSMSLRSPL